MTMGRIGWYAPEAPKRPKTPVLEVHFADGGALLATEGGTRKSMRVGLYDAAGLEGLLGHLGPEPLDDAFDLAALQAVLDHAPRQLNALLRDGRAIAGIGRAFADEILHAAMLSPFPISTRLDADGRARLYTAIREVLERGVAECSERQGLVLPRARTTGGCCASTATTASRARAAPRRCGSSTSSRTGSSTARAARPAARCSPTGA